VAVIGAPTADTWPKVLRDNAEQLDSGSTAIRYKHYGVWQSHSWQDYLSRVKYLSLGLRSLGFEPGSRLLIVGDNSPEWYFAQMAAQCNRGVSIGLYSDLSAAEIEHVARDSEAAFAMVEDQEQADKITEIRDRLPHLKAVVFWRYKGLADRDTSMLVGLREVEALGEEYESAHPGSFEAEVEAGDPDDVCSIIYTSGTGAGGPKGTLHSHRSLMANTRLFCEGDGLGPKDDLACYLPPAWATEQWLGIGAHLLSGGTMNFAESAATHQEDIREIAPDLLVYSSRLWESLVGQIQTKMSGAGRLKRAATRRLMPVGYRSADLAYEGRSPSVSQRVLGAIADRMIFRPIRDSLGLPDARVCYTSGSTLAPEALHFFHALRVPLKNTYGSAEAGAVTGAGDKIQAPDTVGTVNEGVEVKVIEGGELAVRHAGTFLGYSGHPEWTEAIKDDGWVRTGDVGSVDQGGRLAFVDRLSDLIAVPEGALISPQGVESRLKSSLYIKDVWVLDRKGSASLAAVVVVDAGTAGRWADTKRARYTTFADLSQNDEIYSLIEQEILAVNRGLPEGERIEKFVNLHRPFDPDELELTRDRKLRRASLGDRYRALVEAFAGETTSVALDAGSAELDVIGAGKETTLRVATVGREGR
jgi:long-chain acyl-CoA synthetase